jgi:hypothetical protein
MPNVDPIVRFWLGVVVTVAIGVTQGTLVLSGAIPADWIKPVTAWCGIIAFLGSAFLTTLNGGGATVSSRVASAASVPGVKQMNVTPEVAAQVTQATRANATIVTIPDPAVIAAAREAAPAAAAVAAPPAAEIAVAEEFAKRDGEHK